MDLIGLNGLWIGGYDFGEEGHWRWSYSGTLFLQVNLVLPFLMVFRYLIIWHIITFSSP